MVEGSTWQLQEAKAKLSEVIRRARRDGPQTITVHGRPTVVFLSPEEYERLLAEAETAEDGPGVGDLE